MRLLLYLVIFIATCIKASKDTDDGLRCMNFYGLETESANFVCSWVHPPRYYLQLLKEYMFINSIRVPFSQDYVKKGDFRLLDQFFDDCDEFGILIILDYHRTHSTHQSPSPTSETSYGDFLDTWITLLNRYKDRPSMYGVSIFNEIQFTNDFTYSNNIHATIITDLERLFPERFYYFAGCPNWGGNCSGMELSNHPVWNRTFIEVHKYQFSGTSTPEDWEVSIPPRIPADHWFIGEFGWRQDSQQDRNWANMFIDYMRARKIYNACAWTIAHSSDTQGWWNDDCNTFDWDKANLLFGLWFY